MLKAKNQNNDFILSYSNDVKRTDIFFCPICNEQLIFVDSNFKVKHFRHKVETHCEPEPETKTHIQMKSLFIELYNLKTENIEVNLGFAVPDILLNEQKIAIEVQHSPISYDDFIRRTKNYSLDNIHVLWVFDKCLIKPMVSETIKKAHQLYFGRVYIYDNGVLCKIKISSDGRYIESNDFGGGYFKWYKKRKKIEIYPLIKEDLILIKTVNNWKNDSIRIARFNDKNNIIQNLHNPEQQTI